VALLINSAGESAASSGDYVMRRAAIQYRIPYITTISAAADAISALCSRRREVRSIQERTGALVGMTG